MIMGIMDRPSAQEAVVTLVGLRNQVEVTKVV